jgi:hypothetical protein
MTCSLGSDDQKLTDRSAMNGLLSIPLLHIGKPVRREFRDQQSDGVRSYAGSDIIAGGRGDDIRHARGENIISKLARLF